MNVKFFTTPGGEDVAVLARADFEALALLAAEAEEDAADVAIYDARMAEASPPLPPEVSAAVLHGDSLLKAVRNWRGMTQLEVESRTQIGQGYLSDLESGRRKGTPETLTKLAKAFDVDPSWFL